MDAFLISDNNYFHVSTLTGGTSFIGADNPYLKDFVTSHRLSVGMMPKTLRVPKPGEMLLSVHGSPLGVYKDNNMEAIHVEALPVFLVLDGIYSASTQHYKFF
ncbi:hypothetical protein L195_g040396 [Trifolium pratense]|uniref:Borealin C-terminal domain-containing protein n=1 Tax=Trifolium pratense TaxID=57577 RepID=A0A2K3M0M8_TRIPR|nr:hypothetical protein L195_g036940 [Trifolium pratense]PNX84336.1 hypothetical protein L195_g040396 [Trifolium pratense]